MEEKMYFSDYEGPLLPVIYNRNQISLLSALDVVDVMSTKKLNGVTVFSLYVYFPKSDLGGWEYNPQGWFMSFSETVLERDIDLPYGMISWDNKK